MLKFYLLQKESLFNKLPKLNSSKGNRLQKCQEALAEIRRTISYIKLHFLKNPLDNINYEIFFFREIKAPICAKLFYFLEVYSVELACQNFNEKKKKKHLHKRLKKQKSYLSEHEDFCEYFNANASHKDNKYFVRGEIDYSLSEESIIQDSAPDFHTSHDCVLSKIIAAEEICCYICSELDNLNGAQSSLPETIKTKWTGSMSALVELIYAIHYVGCINKGLMEIKELARAFELMFDIELGDIYKVYQDLIRRQNPKYFLDRLVNSYESRLKQKS